MTIVSDLLKKDFKVFAIVFGLLSLPFFVFPLDVKIQALFFDPQSGFFLKGHGFWDFLYQYGIFLGYMFAFAAFICFALSYWWVKLYKFRNAALVLIFSMVLGPGLLINATFKEHWGRPRPTEIKTFGGSDDYVKPWVMGKGEGKSFPCGHASMGFFMALPFIFLRRYYKKWAWFFMVFGSLYGLLLGITRVVAGGHFASDVVWSAAMVWFSGLAVFHLMGAKQIDIKQANKVPQNKKKAKTMSIIIGTVLPLFIISALLATPYISEKEFEIDRGELVENHVRALKLKFDKGDVQIVFGNNFKVKYEATGFGFPNSKVRQQWQMSDTAVYWLKPVGWFTEINYKIQITLPDIKTIENFVVIGSGDVTLDREYSDSSRVYLDVEHGNVAIYIDKAEDFNLKCDIEKLNDHTGKYISIDTDPQNTYLIIDIGEGSIDTYLKKK